MGIVPGVFTSVVVLRHIGSSSQSAEVPVKYTTPLSFFFLLLCLCIERDFTYRDRQACWWQLGKTCVLIYKIIDIRLPEITPSQ